MENFFILYQGILLNLFFHTVILSEVEGRAVNEKWNHIAPKNSFYPNPKGRAIFSFSGKILLLNAFFHPLGREKNSFITKNPQSSIVKQNKEPVL